MGMLAEMMVMMLVMMAKAISDAEMMLMMRFDTLEPMRTLSDLVWGGVSHYLYIVGMSFF